MKKEPGQKINTSGFYQSGQSVAPVLMCNTTVVNVRIVGIKLLCGSSRNRFLLLVAVYPANK